MNGTFIKDSKGLVSKPSKKKKTKKCVKRTKNKFKNLLLQLFSLARGLTKATFSSNNLLCCMKQTVDEIKDQLFLC